MKDRENVGSRVATMVLLAGALVPLGPEVALAQAPAGFPGPASRWNGYPRHDFEVEGRAAIVVEPRIAAPGTPWIWRARFFGHEPQADLALLASGYHLAYCDVAGLNGSPRAVAYWDAFYRFLVEEHGFAPRAALEAMSRGGLVAYNFAARYPERVACLYADAPVCDFKSWPGGFGTGERRAPQWRECLQAFGLDEEEALAYAGNPVDRLAPLAAQGIPILHVIGTADEVVPPEENSEVVVERYRARGGSIEVIEKPGVGHHPHSLRDPAPIVDFVLEHTWTRHNLVFRGSLHASRVRFETEKRGHVAFLGGSITEREGYRPLVCRFLRERFPETEFEFTNAGIASTGSTTGAFRLVHDVLARGPVDLLFVEFAVNDDQDAAHARRECIRGLEGILRQLRRRVPEADVVVTYFPNPPMVAELTAGDTPLPIAAHEAVAEHYRVPSVHLAREVAERIVEGRLTWEQYGGTHPGPRGNALAAEMLTELLGVAWARPLPAEARAQAHPLPRMPLDPHCYAQGRFLDPERARADAHWTRGRVDWNALEGRCRGRFVNQDVLATDRVGATLEVAFEGTALGAFVLAGPDAGMVEGSIDDRPFAPVDLYHRHSRDLHYPRTVLFASDLAPGPHLARLRVAAGSSSGGHAVRILHLVAN